MKDGIKTTEFWVSIGALLIPIINSVSGLNLDSNVIMGTLGTLASYILGRSYAKAKAQ